jgi:hypothetical protein
VPLQNENRETVSESQPHGGNILPSQADNQILAGISGVQVSEPAKNHNSTPTPAKVAKVAKVLADPPHNFRNFRSPTTSYLKSATPLDPAAECGPYASALAALRAKCPAYVPEDRWRQAIADATTFATTWGAEAQAFGWTAPELFRPASGAGAASA